MTKITEQELLKLATISSIEFVSHDIAPLQAQIQSVLTYAARVQEVAKDTPDVGPHPVNVFRDDAVIRTNSPEIVQSSPETLENYFVVPKILETH
jgi:aspartyl/glutamyl-tRNA(Asn/Gln) amidotransferase C subunit